MRDEPSSDTFAAYLSQQRASVSPGFTPEGQPELHDRASNLVLRRFRGPEHYHEQLDHVRVAHLTDLHVGAVTPLRVHERAVTLTNEQRPDLVVITGDFVNHSQHYLGELKHVLQGFRAPVVCVLGNHDYWSGAGEVRQTLESAGALVLANQSTVLTLRGQKLQLCGLDDAYTGHADRAKATAGLDPGLPTLGLSHIAEEADGLWRCGVPFVLSGHTHAGQITVAKLNELALGKLVGHRYVHGLYGSRKSREASGAVYVGAGIGAAVVPFRWGERGRRELTVFELGNQVSDFAEHHAEQTPLPGRAPSPELVAKRKAAVAQKAARRAQRGNAR